MDPLMGEGESTDIASGESLAPVKATCYFTFRPNR